MVVAVALVPVVVVVSAGSVGSVRTVGATNHPSRYLMRSAASRRGTMESIHFLKFLPWKRGNLVISILVDLEVDICEIASRKSNCGENNNQHSCSINKYDAKEMRVHHPALLCRAIHC